MKAPLSVAAAALALLVSPAMAQTHVSAPRPGTGAHAHADAHGHAHADFASDRMHVRIDGPEGAPDLILVPGLSSSPEVWDGLVAHLGDRFRIHRVHVQGFAGAPPMANAQGPVAAPVAEEIARYIAEAGLERPAVIGHSMGGTIAMMVAARHPQAVGRLMVVDMIPNMAASWGMVDAPPEQLRLVAEQMKAGMMASTDEAWNAQARAAIDGMIATEGLRAGPTQDSLASERSTVADSMAELVQTDLRPELARITAPTEVVYVRFNDARMTSEATDAIYRNTYAGLPGVRLTRIDDSAHFVMLDQPAAFHARVDAFLSAD